MGSFFFYRVVLKKGKEHAVTLYVQNQEEYQQSVSLREFRKKWVKLDLAKGTH
jgi:predicted transcriptional regulator